MSVWEKSPPLNNSGSSNDLASEYEKQSPKFSRAGCRPLPYSVHTRLATKACSSVTGSIRIPTCLMNSSNRWPPASPNCPVATIEASTNVAADSRQTSALLTALANSSYPDSWRRMARTADVSRITSEVRFHHKGTCHDQSEAPSFA